jgi:hypothetical protein
MDDGTNVLQGGSWKAFRELPTEKITVDIHCVTRWSQLGTMFEGSLTWVRSVATA